MSTHRAAMPLQSGTLTLSALLFLLTMPAAAQQAPQPTDTPKGSPLDEIMQQLDEQRSAAAAAAAVTPTATPDHELDSLSEAVRGVPRSLTEIAQAQALLNKSIASKQREVEKAHQRVQIQIQKMRYKGEHFTKSESEWISSIERSIKHEAETHWRRLEARKELVIKAAAPLTECSQRERELRRRPATKEALREIEDLCLENLKAAKAELTGLTADTEGQHKQVLKALKVAEQRLEATMKENYRRSIRQKGRPTAPNAR